MRRRGAEGVVQRLFTGLSAVYSRVYPQVRKAPKLVGKAYLCSMNEKLKVDEMGRLGLSDFRAARKFPLSVVLDNVRSVHNVGSVFRTADAFRLREVLLCGITAIPPSAEMHKTALGAEDSVAWRHFASTADALAELRARGVKVCVLEQCRRSGALQDFVFEPGSEYALVLGHEVHGVAQSVVDAADVVLEIPQFGTKHSLNVSVAAGMALWEMVKKGRFV